MVRSRNAMTIRNLDHASHAQNSTVLAPSMTGPSPKSYCSHRPGSVTQGRWTRAFPNRYCFLISATARRDDRSDPGNPIAISLSWAMSARILPFDVSTHSSTFGRYSSINLGRHVRGRAPPASRSATTRATVWWEHPARSAVARNEPVKSNDSNISMDSSADFTVVPPGGSSGASAPPSGLQEGPQPRDAAGDGGRVGSTNQHPPAGRNPGHQRAVSWPPMGSFSWPPTRRETGPRLAWGRRMRGARGARTVSAALLVGRRREGRHDRGHLPDRASPSWHALHLRAHGLHRHRWVPHGEAGSGSRPEEDARRRPTVGTRRWRRRWRTTPRNHPRTEILR